MKITECYVDGFGKISNRKYTFNAGLNIFKEDNGYGKTTLSVFIKSMFYGLEDTKKAKLEENDRKHYLPWRGDSFGGYLIFEVNSKEYKVERTFSSKASDDSFAIYDLKTGKLTTDYSKNLGEELFGIDADGFERTVFLSERNLSVKNDNKSISAKLSDLVGADGDVGGLDKALSLLEDRRKYYHKRGGAGKIRDLKSQIIETDTKINALTRLSDSMDEKSDRRKSLSEDLKNAEEKRTALETKNRRTSYEKQYALMRKEEAESKARLDQLSDFFKNKIPSPEEIRNAERWHDEYVHLSKSEASEEKKQSDSSYKENLVDEYIRLAKQAESNSNNVNKSFLLLYSLALLSSFLFVGLGLFVSKIIYTGLIVSLILVFVGYQRFKKYNAAKKSKNKLLPIYDFVSGYGFENAEKKNLTDILFTIKAREEARAEFEKRKEEEKLINEKRRDEIKRTYDNFISLFPTVSDTPLKEIRDALSEREYLQRTLEAQKSRMAHFIREYGINDTLSDTPTSAEEDESSAFVLDVKIQELRTALIISEREYAADLAELSTLDELKEKRAELSDEYESAAKTHDAILITEEHLSKAKNLLTAKYLGKTRAAFAYYLSAMSEENAEQLIMDTDFGVSKSEGGKSYSTDAYSLGTRDFYAIVSRLALTDSLYENEKPFLVLDDPFAHFDDSRTDSALRILKKLGEKRQIIYFTCSKSRTV